MDRRQVTGFTLGQLLDPASSASRLRAAGMSDRAATEKGELFADAANALFLQGRKKSNPAVAVYVPGRIEVLGKHTDYCGGRSLLCTLERGMCFVALPRSNPVIRFNACDLNDNALLSIDASLEPAQGHWSNYPMTVARRISRNFPSASTGADIAMASDLPRAAGLSSSSALIIGTFMILSAINQLDTHPRYRRNLRSREHLAGYLGCIENGQSFGELVGDKGVGTFGGSQDHTAILCCKPGKLSVYSFCPVNWEQDIEFPDDIRFAVFDSGVVAEKTREAKDKYNRVSQRAGKIVSLWNEATRGNATCLRDVVQSRESALVELGELLKQNADLDPEWRLSSRLDQFVSESTVLIPAAADAIKSRDYTTLRQVVDASQLGAETSLENQVPATIDLQRSLLKHGAIAASAFGAGFGGSVWALYRQDDSSFTEYFANDNKAVLDIRPGCPATMI